MGESSAGVLASISNEKAAYSDRKYNILMSFKDETNKRLVTFKLKTLKWHR